VESPAPSYTDLVIKLTSVALQEHPALNARWEDEGIVLCRRIHIGFAVDTETGLVAPVIRDVPALSLQQLAARSRELIERARSRKLTAEEMQGGTFTVTNLGPFGIDAFTPIINHPECAILGVGRIRRQPAVVGEQIVPRDMVTLSLTFDHRIVDGAPAARFLDTLRRCIEDPEPRLGR
jgi:pyruvate dehydrogenase E2 component (dihydrolipoamide acetyltransferase)